MATQENKRPQDLPHGRHFEAILLASSPPIRAIGRLFLVPRESYNYDGIFELADARLLQHMTKFGTKIGVDDLGTQTVQVVVGCESDSDPHIHFRWVDKFD